MYLLYFQYSLDADSGAAASMGTPLDWAWMARDIGVSPRLYCALFEVP
jgi:hypothetical protein